MLKSHASGVIGNPPRLEAYSIAAFCKAHCISRGTFYNLRKAGRAPRLMRVGGRILISREAAAEWRRESESEAV